MDPRPNFAGYAMAIRFAQSGMPLFAARGLRELNNLLLCINT